MPSLPDAEEIATRLDRMKRLSQQLEAAQHDQREFTALMQRIRTEAEEFRRTLGTHDLKSDA